MPPAQVPAPAACRLRALLLVAGLLCICAGCSEEPEADESSARDTPGAPGGRLGDAGGSPATVSGGCTSGALRVRRVAPWPGGGIQVTVELPLGAADAELELLEAEGVAVPAFSAPAPEPAGITAVVVRPDAGGPEHATRIAAARAVVEALPAGERVGLWVSASALALHAELTEVREHVFERLDAVPPQPGMAPPDVTLADLQELLARVGNGHGPVSRDVVLVDGNPPDLEAVLGRRKRLVRLGVCPPAVHGGLFLRLGEASCTLDVPAPIAHMAGVACDAGEAARDEYPYGRDVALLLTAEERQVLDAYRKGSIEDDFTARVSIGPAAPIEARVHLRGATSLDRCQRKSFTVDLDGPDARRLMPGGAADTFHLLSLCQDDRYFHQATALRLLRMVGSFPLSFRYVRLFVGGSNQGVYLMVEHVRDTLLSDHAATSGIIRRRFDPGGAPEDVKWPKDPQGAADALARYHAIADLVASTPPDLLAEKLREVLALDQYLLFIALNTLLQNGDYIDEAYFYASAEAGGQWYFRHAAWDPEDLLRPCHHEGVHAVVVPHGLAYCAEANLDRALEVSGAVFGRYVELLESLLLEKLSPDLLAAVVDEVREELWQVLDDDETAKALVELVEANPSAATAAGAREDIAARMAELVEAVEARRTALLQGISAWRAEQR